MHCVKNIKWQKVYKKFYFYKSLINIYLLKIKSFMSVFFDLSITQNALHRKFD